LAIEHGYVAIQWVQSAGRTLPSSVVHRDFLCGKQKDIDLATLPVHEVDGELSVSYRGSTRTVRWCLRCEDHKELDFRWQDEARCRDTWPVVNMLEVGQGGRHIADRLIAEYCDPCPVAYQCAVFALDQGERDIQGIWGGVFIAEGGGANHQKSIQALKQKHAILRSDVA
jgi:hypothetical protein